MSRKIIRKVKAIWDVIELAEFIGKDSPGAEARFLAAVEEVLLFLADRPEIAAIWETNNPNYKNMRCWSVSGFPHHLIFYRAIQEGIEVIRVLHSSRDLENLFLH